MTLKPYDEQSDKELMGLAGVQGGAHIESMLRLRVAVEKQTRSSDRLTRVMIALMVVQILVMAMQIVVAVYQVTVARP